MKPASRAPAYAAIYHGLAEVARGMGYALAIHGSLQNDLDLIAVPWVDDAAAPELLAHALCLHVNACWVPTYEAQFPMPPPEQKPHGRVAWNLYGEAGSAVDLSVMPRVIGTSRAS